MCNLSLTCLSLNKISECLTYFNSCLELVRGQFELNEKVEMLKELVYIFFRIDSLQKYYETANNGIDGHIKQGQNQDRDRGDRDKDKDKDRDNNTGQDADISTLNNRMASKTLFALHRTLREGNIEYWMKCLNEEGKKLRNPKDINGYIFVMINSLAANYYQTGKITDAVKTNFSKILKIYAEQYNKDLKLKEKNLNLIFTDFKNRIDTAMDIYKRLLDTETELNNIVENINASQVQLKEQGNNKGIKKDDIGNSNNKVDNSISNKIFVRIFFKRALNILNDQSERVGEIGETVNPDKIDNPNLSSDMKSQIELALKLLENDEFDFSSMNILNINSEITKSLKLLIENLILIRSKCLVFKSFKNYVKKTFGYEDILSKRKHKIKLFMENRLEKICKGGLITKIHFRSSGFSKHYYRIDLDSKSMLIYKSQIAFEAHKVYHVIHLSEIKQVVYGLSTENLKKKCKNSNSINFKKPFLFLSLILAKRTIDLYFEEESNLNIWFYGLNYLIKGYNLSIEIISVTKFILLKLKLKLIAKLREISENDEKNPNKSLLILTQLNNYANTNQMGFDSLSLIHVLLLYLKIIDKQNK